MHAVGRCTVDVPCIVAEREHPERDVEGQRVAGAAAVAVGCHDCQLRERPQRVREALQTLLGFEEISYFVMFAWLGIAGPGPVSLDHLVLKAFRKERPPSDYGA